MGNYKCNDCFHMRNETINVPCCTCEEGSNFEPSYEILKSKLEELEKEYERVVKRCNYYIRFYNNAILKKHHLPDKHSEGGGVIL